MCVRSVTICDQTEKPPHRLSLWECVTSLLSFSLVVTDARANYADGKYTGIFSFSVLHVPILPPFYADKETTADSTKVLRFTYSKPLVVENLLNSDPVIHVSGEHPLYEIFRRLADGIPEWRLHLQI